MSSNDSFYFLNGGGEMGKLIREKNWSQTPLGDPESWPLSLQTAVSIVLNNPSAMYIAWGKEQIQLYNDAYITILGNEKHPHALGNKSSETFSEIWSTVEPLFKAVIKGEAVRQGDYMLLLDRSGSIENYYFDFAYSPIFLPNGTVGGVLVTILETTKKNTVEQYLNQSEQHFKILADNIPNLSWMANADGAVYWYNKKWYEYTGTTFEEMQGWGWKSVYKEEDLEAVVYQWELSLKAEVPFEMIYPIRRADGIYRQFLTRALPLRNDLGEITTWFGTNTDVTAQKAAEKAVVEGKKELEFVIEAAKLGTFDYNPITNKFSANARLKNWFGLSSDQEIDIADATNVIIEKDRVAVIEAIQSVLEFSSGGNYDIAYDIVNPITKKQITLHAKGKAYFDDQGKVLRLNGTVEDITAQTIARKKLERSENELRLMILQAPIAISIFKGPDYVIEITNKIALQIWNKTEDELLNKSIFDSIPELKEQGIKEILDEVRLSGKRFSTTEFPIEVLRFGKFERVYMNFSYEPLFDENNKINRIMAIGYDVTTQVVAGQEIEKSEQRIRVLVESAPFPIAVYTGEEMRITLANQSIIEAWGKQTDVIGKLYTDILPELANQNIYEQIRGVYATGIAFHAKNQRVGIVTDGILKYFYFNYSFTPLRDSDGKIYGVMNTAADMTELNEAKDKVEESEKRFRDAVLQAPVAIVKFTGKDNIVDMVNTSYLEIVDKSELDFLSKPLFDSLPEVKEVIDPIIKDIYKTQKPFFGYEFPVDLVRFGKKEVAYFNFVYQPLIENGKVTGIMVVAADVTTNVIANKELEDNEQRLNLVIDASELGIWELNLETDVTKVSERALIILGVANEKNPSREILSSKMHPADLPIRKAAFETAFKTGILQYEIRTIVDGIIHWIEAKGKVFFNKKKKAIRIIGTLRDVTEEKNIQTQLLEREEKFRLLADSMPQFVWTADQEGKLTYFNQAVFDFSGYSEYEIMEKGWLSIVHDEEREENTRKWIEAVSSEKDFIMEHRFRKRDGSYRWQLSRAIPQRDKEGKITMWVGTSTDIQEQKMFSNELERQVTARTKELYNKNDDLEKMNKELQSFAYISSHDLQEPLRKIQTFATQINEAESDNLSERGKDKFRRMQGAADRMQTLIQDLLAYSRTSVQERVFEKTTISGIVEEVKEDLEHDFTDKNATITILNDCQINVITFQFRQLLFNLVSNSLKFTKENDIPQIVIDCTIGLGVEFENHKLIDTKKYSHIKIQDNGIGFEEEYSEKIFEVFQRLHGKEKFNGTGIGLAIVKRIVDNHHGIITATGVLHKGATFNIYIPFTD